MITRWVEYEKRCEMEEIVWYCLQNEQINEYLGLPSRPTDSTTHFGKNEETTRQKVKVDWLRVLR